MRSLNPAKRTISIAVGLLFIVLPAYSAFAQGGISVTKTRTDLSEANKHQVFANYARLPLSFEVNHGQSDARVKFLSHGAGYTLFLTPTEAVLALQRSRGTAATRPQVPAEPALGVPAPGSRALPGTIAGSEKPGYTAVFMKLVGANPAGEPEVLAELPGKSNYFIGSDPKQWHTDVPTYGGVNFHAVYPGVDVVYHGNQQRLEHDFIVAPGGDPGAITLGFEGVEKLSINPQGDLVIASQGVEVCMEKPVVYQEVGGTRKAIAGNYVLKGNSQASFEVGRYDVTKPLVIDPILTYSTYLGGSLGDYAYGVAVDSAGSAYVTGYTESTTDFPTTPGAFQPSFGGYPYDGFVTKLNAAGTALVYSTYLGGNSYDYGFGIAVDSAGSAYVAGYTHSTDFPTTPGAFRTTWPGGGDTKAFVTKLNAAGSGLAYSTYLGGTSIDYAFGIAVDSAGSAYVTGVAASSDFPITAGAFQTVFAGYPYDGFVTKLNAAGSGLGYSTFLGGSFADYGAGIAVDSAGSAYVTGYTESTTDFPTTSGAFQTSLSGYACGGFVTKLNAAGSGLAYSTFLGGSTNGGMGLAEGIAVDSSGSAYVTGLTDSISFPTTPGAFQTTFGGYLDAFVSKLNATGSALAYSTYLGGSNNDYGLHIAVDSAGSAYLTGYTISTNFPTTPGAFQTSFGGGYDAFMTKLNATGSGLAYSTYLGGNTGDIGRGIAVDSGGSAYVAGETQSSNFPTTPGAFQMTFGGGSSNAFVAKLVNSPQAQVTSLQNAVKALVSAGTLKAVAGRLLLVPLNAALVALARGHAAAAILELKGFITDVRLLFILRALPTAEGNTLIGAANSIIAALRV